MLYVYKKYGLKLSTAELDDLLEWYDNNKELLSDEAIVDKETRKYLYEKYKGRRIHLREEDLSNMKHLLALLKEKTKGKKNE